MLSRVQLCDPTDYNPPDSSVHGIPQARILEWVAISFSARVIKLVTIVDIINLSFTTHTPP